MTPGISHQELQRIAHGSHFDPHSILGAHLDGRTLTFRSLKPEARAVSVRLDDQLIPMTQEIPGIWVASMPHDPGSPIPPYTLETLYSESTFTSQDPYRFLPTLGELDLHLIA